jgi:hypothetical protein
MKKIIPDVIGPESLILARATATVREAELMATCKWARSW